MAQINPVVGDLGGNLLKIQESYRQAVTADCAVVVFGELTVTGYPPEDLVLKQAFVRDNIDTVQAFAATTGSCAAVVGFVDTVGDQLFNAAALCCDGRVVSVYHKQLLPNYSVFDEERYFAPGAAMSGTIPSGVVQIGGVTMGITICEDMWFDIGPVSAQAQAGARIIVNINGSPFHVGKQTEREKMLSIRASTNSCAIIYVNQVGGQDELVFDGASVVFDAHGKLVSRMASFVEGFSVVQLNADGIGAEAEVVQTKGNLDTMYEALVLGTRDYVRKNGFTDVVIGLSGGIDSTLVAVIAVDALGAEHVHGVAMPSRYSSQGSLDDAATLANNLGIDHRVISIEPAFSSYLEMLAPSFIGRNEDLTEENLQSRCRGTTLMALSNKFGWMVLTTGNKSEIAVGYFTIYGDSAGGFAVIKDVFKTDVFALCRRYNERAGHEVIPLAVIDKPPSAELRPDQRDDQSLPPYDELDPILEMYIDGDLTVADIVARGADETLVRRLARLVDLSEYKRRQTAPGVRVSSKAFGRDRRVPITHRYT
ncbi:MAG: NAD+ synthase [Ilumatobacteraceae bacterium]|nr:NAD+ synthase [Ilumatobacteraceae bacterium]